MSPRLMIPLFMLLALLAGCGRDDPQAALEAAVERLQSNLEGKKTAAVLKQLHPQFAAQQQYDLQWAKRTMVLLFMRHQEVKVIALSQSSRIDPTYSSKAQTEAQIALTGAQGLIPDSAGHYSVKLEWWLEDNEWRLARLDWQ